MEEGSRLRTERVRLMEIAETGQICRSISGSLNYASSLNSQRSTQGDIRTDADGMLGERAVELSLDGSSIMARTERKNYKNDIERLTLEYDDTRMDNK